MPLFKQKAVSGEKLFQDLRDEAEELRKEKKRNTFSGIHKYDGLLISPLFRPQNKFLPFKQYEKENGTKKSYQNIILIEEQLKHPAHLFSSFMHRSAKFQTPPNAVDLL